MKKLALALAGIVLALVITEVFLRVTGIGMIQPIVHFRERGRAYLESGLHVLDPHLFWRRPPGPLSDAERSINLIRVDDPAPPRSERFRIIVLGDSCTRLSRSGRPYSACLQAELGDDLAEVFNASLPGYTSYQGRVWFERKLRHWQPDLVIVYFGWNDHWRATGYTDVEYAATLSRWRPRLLNLFLQRRDPPPKRVSVAQYRENLRRITEMAAAAGGHTLIVLGPHSLNRQNIQPLLQNRSIGAGDDPTAIHLTYLEAARGLAGDPDPAVFDAAALFARLDQPEVLLMRDGIHPSDPGHAVLGATLADLVRARYLGVPGELPDPVRTAQDVLARLAND